MDNRESNLAWWIAGILLILLIVVGYLWLSSKSLPSVLEDNKTAIEAQRDQIAKDCQGAARNPTACRQDLTDLSNILQEFSSDLQDATSTAGH